VFRQGTHSARNAADNGPGQGRRGQGHDRVCDIGTSAGDVRAGFKLRPAGPVRRRYDAFLDLPRRVDGAVVLRAGAGGERRGERRAGPAKRGVYVGRGFQGTHQGEQDGRGIVEEGRDIGQAARVRADQFVLGCVGSY